MESEQSGAFFRVIDKESVSVFESVRSYKEVIFRLEDHLERLYASAKTVGLKIHETPLELEGRLYQALEQSGKKDAFLRLTITAYGISVMVTSRDYPQEVFEKGVRIQTSAVKKSVSGSFYPEAKTSSYGPQILATLEMPESAFEVFFLSQEGYLRETRTSNVFMVKNGILKTPPCVGVLDGVTRRVVFETAREISLPVEEVYLTRHDLFNAEEVFLTNTSGEIVPVREIDGRIINNQVPGVWTKRLRMCFGKKVREYRKEHRRVKN